MALKIRMKNGFCNRAPVLCEPERRPIRQYKSNSPVTITIPLL